MACGWSFKTFLLFVPLALLAAQSPPPDLREAARLDQVGRCEEAETIYQRALARGTPGPALLNNTGNHYLACGQPDKARHFFEQLLRLAPSHVNASLQLARLSMSDNQFARAEELLQKLAAARPADFDILFLLGQASARARHFSRARSTLEAALRLRPDHTGALLECGLANAAVRDFPRAVFLLARAQSRAPDQPAIALALARASEDAGYHGDAVLAYDRYLKLRPEDNAAERDRARALSLTIDGRQQGARELEGYVASHPKDPLGHFYRAQIRWNEDAEAALEDLAEALRLKPDLPDAHVARAWLLHRVGRDTEALPHLNAALRIVPANVRALDQLGVVLLSLDRSAEAESTLRRAAELAPTDPEVALHLGRALMDVGKEQEGEQWLERYQKLRPARKRDARRESGMIELATLDPAGRRAREIERFRSMARARPDDPLLQLHLSQLLLADGQVPEALSEYEILSKLNGDAAIWAQAGRALLQAGEYGEARQFLKRAGARIDLAEALLASEAPDAALTVLAEVPASEQTVGYTLLKARALFAAGRAQESGQWLDKALSTANPEPEVARQGSLLLAQHGRHRESLELLSRAISSAPAARDLRLTEAVVLALGGRTAEAEKHLRQIQARWPEWDQPWLVHGLVLTDSGQHKEATSKFRAAAALGPGEEPVSCESLRTWVFGRCGKQPR